MEQFDRCGGAGQPNDSFNPNVRLTFKAINTGDYYLKLTNQDPQKAGDKVAYQLSVQELANTPTPGLLVLVGGRLKANDPLQPNIYKVTDAVYRLFANYGYTADRIYYLASDLKLNPDNDPGTVDVNGLPNKENLRYALTEWTTGKGLGPARAFTLYMMDHGDKDKFYLNTSSETIDPDTLNGWLNTLEAANPGVKVNVILEACLSGSFIVPDKSISKAGRLVIASTSALNNAYGSINGGALFSDYFIQSLGRGASVYNSFAEGRESTRRGHADQTPWLDSNGNGIPNEPADFLEAQQRGFAYAGTFAANEKLPPYIAWGNGPTTVVDRKGELTAKITDDVPNGKLTVKAIIYKPSYITPTTTESLVAEYDTLSKAILEDSDKDNIYRGLYEGFNEMGTYRIVIYAEDEDGLQSRPQEIFVSTGTQVYLPIIVK